MIKPANKSTLHDNVLTQMVQTIKEGVWQPGEKIPGEQELARQFQVSRNCIREVLKALSLSGVITAHPGQGTFLTRDALQKLEGGSFAVSVLGDAALWQLMEVRLLLEGHMAFLAAKRATEADIQALQASLQSREPEAAYKQNDFRFHKLLASMAGNDLLGKILSSIQGRMEEMRHQYGKMPGKVVKYFDQEHSAIFEHIRDRKPEQARAVMIEHIEKAWMDVLYAELQQGGTQGQAGRAIGS